MQQPLEDDFRGKAFNQQVFAFLMVTKKVKRWSTPISGDQTSS